MDRELRARFGPLAAVRGLVKAIGHAVVAEMVQALVRLEKAGP